MAEGKDVLARSKEWGKKYYQVRILKEKMEVALREHMGADAVADAMRGQRGLGTFMRSGNVLRVGSTEKEESSSSSGALFFSFEAA